MGKYDNHLFRVSSLAMLTAGLETYDKLYESAKAAHAEQNAKVDKYREEYNSMNQATKTADKKLQVLNNASEKLDILAEKMNNYKHLVGRVAISEGCKSHLTDLWIAHEFGRVKDIKSKYIQKGLEMETQSIELYSREIKGRYMEKNTERRDDGYITGEIDIEDSDHIGKFIVDMKNSWDLYTFFRNVKYIDNPRQCPYYEPAQGYMKLWDLDRFRVTYALIDTPKRIIEAEKKRLLYDFIGSEEDYEAACFELENNLTFADIDIKRRFIEVDIKRDEDFISIIQPTIISCREFLNSFKETYYEMD